MGTLEGMLEADSEVEIGLTKAQRTRAAEMLSRLLADTFVLSMKTRQCHWNVVGSDFAELHRVFGEQYAALDAQMDDVAERQRAMGGFAGTSIPRLLKAARIEEEAGGDYGDAMAMLKTLLTDHEIVIREVRDDIREVEKFDCVTANFLQDIVAAHEKTAWMIRATLQ